VPYFVGTGELAEEWIVSVPAWGGEREGGDKGVLIIVKNRTKSGKIFVKNLSG